jgi:hypothetical protein
MSAELIRKKFIEDCALKLLDEYIAIVLGEKDQFTSKSAYHVASALGIIEQLILKASDLTNIEAATVGDIVKAIGKGKMSLDDGMKFMSVLQTKQNIEELPQLLEAIQKLNETR